MPQRSAGLKIMFVFPRRRFLHRADLVSGLSGVYTQSACINEMLDVRSNGVGISVDLQIGLDALPAL